MNDKIFRFLQTQRKLKMNDKIWEKMKEDEIKIKSGFNIPSDFDSHVFAYWRSYFPFVPTSHRAYVGHKQAC